MLLADFAGVAIDHARRFTRSETRRVDLQHTVEALDASMQISRALGGETDVDAILQLVAKRARALVSARTVLIEHSRDGHLVVAVGAGEFSPDLVGQEIDPHDSVAGAAMRSARTLRLEDEPNQARFERHGLGALGFHATRRPRRAARVPGRRVRSPRRDRPHTGRAGLLDRRPAPAGGVRGQRRVRRGDGRIGRASTGAASDSPPPTRNGRDGLANCTTRPFRLSPRYDSDWPPRCEATTRRRRSPPPASQWPSSRRTSQTSAR